jgi:hypothetical protein
MPSMRSHRRLLFLPLAAVLALVAAACGGSTGSAGPGSGRLPDGASVAPASAPAFVSIVTDPDSAQWKQADALLSMFPGRGRILASIEKALNGQGVSYERDVEPALGPELDVAVLGLAKGSHQVVALTQPQDKAKLDALVAELDASSSRKAVTAEYKGWTLLSDSQAAIDRFTSEADRGALSDDATFKEAMANEPGDALGKAYVNGASLDQVLGGLSGSLGNACTGGQPTAANVRYVGASLAAASNGVKLHAAVQSGNSTKGSTYSSELVSEIPSGALLVLSFHGSPAASLGLQGALQACQGQAGRALHGVEQLLGIKLSDLGTLFSKESALYVRSGSPIPEVTLVSKQDDPQQALATIDAFATRLAGLAGGGQPEATTVDGVPAKKIVVGGKVTIYYAALKDEVVVTDSEAGITDLQSSGPKLKDDPTFTDARKAAGMPSETSGFLYADLKDGIPLVEGLARLAGTSVPSDVDANLRPLQTLTLWGASDTGKADLTAFLQIGR